MKSQKKVLMSELFVQLQNLPPFLLWSKCILQDMSQHNILCALTLAGAIKTFRGFEATFFVDT